MIEIFALWLACKNIAQIVRPKGLRARPFQIRTVLLWFLFEFLGIFFAIGIGIDGGPFLYIAALLGAFLSLHFSFSHARKAVPRHVPDDQAQT